MVSFPNQNFIISDFLSDKFSFSGIFPFNSVDFQQLQFAKETKKFLYSIKSSKIGPSSRNIFYFRLLFPFFFFSYQEHKPTFYSYFSTMSQNPPSQFAFRRPCQTSEARTYDFELGKSRRCVSKENYHKSRV